MMLKLDLYEKKWHNGSDGNRMCTMLRRRNPIMDSIRRRGLHSTQEETPPIRQGEVDMTSLGDAVAALSGYQVAETQWYLADSNRGYPAMAARHPVVACLLMSPDLGEERRCGGQKKSGLGL